MMLCVGGSGRRQSSAASIPHQWYSMHIRFSSGYELASSRNLAVRVAIGVPFANNEGHAPQANPNTGTCLLRKWLKWEERV